MDRMEEAAKLLAESSWTVALTGAGISVDSGIPDFRSPGGLWDRFDPYEYAHIDAFRRDPDKVWTMLREMNDIIHNARPNEGHQALANLESKGILKAVITQNIDNLHQEAGSREVIEFHGNGRTLVCLDCGSKFNTEDAQKRAMEKGEWPPSCPNEGSALKPDVIFFGEAPPLEESARAQQHAQESDVMLVVGTSATVFPANGIPLLAWQTGAKIIEINKTTTHLTGHVAQISLHGSSSEILPKLVQRVWELKS